MSPPGPLTMADPHEGIIPHRYVIVVRSQRCDCCGSVHKWSELYAQTFIKSYLGVGKQIVNYRRLDWPKFRLPIERTEVEKEELLPFCHACNAPSLMNNLNLPDPPYTDPQRIMGSSFPKGEPKADTAKRPRTKEPPLTPAQLLKDLLS